MKGLSLLVLFLLAGEMLARFLHLPLPGSVLGMLLLLLALQTGVVRAETVQATAEFLGRNLALFFVPAGVAVIQHGSELRAAWLPLLVASVISTLAVLAVVGLLQQRGER